MGKYERRVTTTLTNKTWICSFDSFISLIQEEISYKVVGQTSGQCVKPKNTIVGLEENISSEIFSPLCDVRLNGVSNVKSFFFETSSILKYIIKAMINKIEADKIDTFKNKLFIFLESYVK